MIKKSLTLLLAILMVVSMMPMNAFASSGITYVVEDAGETETSTPEPEGEESEQGGAVVSEETTYVAKIGTTEYATFAGAMTAANAMTGDVVVDIYGEVEFVDGMELKGSYTSITFNGKASGAKITINQSAGGDYLEAHGKTVAFNDLILAKANPAWAGNSGHMGNYFSIQGGTATYTNCTFPNGACTSGGTATYNNCTFQNASEYGIWVYDDALVTVNGGTIDSTKGIKVYSEDEASVTSTLTVQNATFTENVTSKPAVAIGYAESITLIGNTYNNTTGVLELDSGSDADCEGITFVAEDAKGNDISSTLTAVDRSNGNAACGVLVDGKIYTTVTEAAKDATSGDTVTLLYNSAEDVEFAEGVTINKNNYTADNVTVAIPVAQIGDVKYTSLEAAFAAAVEGDTIVLLADAAPVLSRQSAITAASVIDLNDKTLTLNEYDLYFGTTTFKNGTIVVAPNATKDSGTAVFWMFEGQTLTFDKVEVIATGFKGNYLMGTNGGTGAAISLTNGSKITIANTATTTLTAVIAGNSTNDQIVIENSTIDVSNIEGRVALGGCYTVNNSTINANGVKEGFYLRANQSLSIEGTSDVEIVLNDTNGRFGINVTDMSATYTVADTATVTATVHEITPVAMIGTTKYATLQDAIDAVQNGETIVLLADCDETVTFTQTKDLSFVLDGNDKIMTGSINITARAGKGAESTLVIKNFKFTTDKTSHDFIKSVETNYYPNNITIQNCSFTGTGDINAAGYAVVAVRLKSANNILIKDCTGTGLHSFLQNTAGWVVNLDNVDVTNSLGGFAMGTVQGTNIANCDLNVRDMGIRLDAQYNNNAVIADNNITAFIPVVVRKASVDSSISFNGTNTMTKTNTDGLWCAIGTSEYKENGTMPTAPTGKVTVTLNDTGLSTDGLYGHYVEPPKGDTPHAYTSETTIWGQTWSNAKESYVIKIVDANGNVMGTSTLNTELDVSMDGDVEVTWHISLDPASDTDEYWIQEWTIAPSVTNIPTKVELWVDGVKVNEGNIRLNGPDNIAKIYAAEVDADGKITGYCTLDTFVSKISDLTDRRILVLRDVTFSSTKIRCVEFISGVEGGVTVTNTDVENWIDFDFVTVGKGVTVNVELPFSGDSENVIEGTLNAGETYYHGYDAKTTVQNGGKVVVEGTTILRYNENADSGIYVYGDGDSSTVEFDCGYYIGAYSGTFYAEDANVECGYFLLKNSYDNSTYADIDMTLDNSTLTVAGTTDGQDSFIIDDQASLTLKNDSAIADVRDFNILAGADLDLTVDGTSSIDATNVSIAEDVPFKYEDGRFAPKTFEKDSNTNTAVIYNLDGLKAFRDEVNGGTTFAGWTITLDADIDLGSEEWTPIGNSTNKFQGTFDGNNKTISNLVITGNKSDVGFFGFTTNGEIKNLTIHNAKVSGYLDVAVVAGTPYTSKYTNITVTGHVEVNGFAYVGGVGGKNAYANWTAITVDVDSDSYVKATSTTESGTAYRTYVGGVIGFIGEGGHTFKNISSNIKVIGDVCDVGGLFGIAHYGNNFENVTFAGSVTNTNTDAVDATETGAIAGTWHNQKGYKVTITGITIDENATVTTLGNTVAASEAIMGAAYSASKNTPSNSGDLVINGESTWVKVAKIGDVQYATLQAAIDAVQEGETIVLLDNVTVAEAAFGQNALNHARAVSFTLDLNGKTLSADTGNSVFRFNLTGSGATSNITVTIKNGKIVSGANTWCTVMASGIDGAKAIMNLEDLTIENNKGGDFAVKAWANGVVNAKDVTINASYGGGFYAVGGEIVLDDCVVNQEGLWTAPYNSMAFGVSNGGQMTINSGIYTAVPVAAADGNNQGTSHGSWCGGIMSSGGTLIINGGTFSNGNIGGTASNPRELFIVGADADYGDDVAAYLEINGGTFNSIGDFVHCETIWGSENDSANTYMPTMEIVINNGDFIGVTGKKVIGGCDPITTGNPVDVMIYGGVYSADVDDKYLGLGYTCVEENGTYRVKSAVEVKIGNKSYATLAEAVAAAKPGDTLLLQANVNIDAPIDVTKSIAIVDYGTYTITFASGAGFVVTENASLTLDNILFVGGISDVTVFAATPSYFVVVDGANANVTIDNVATDSSIYVSADADGSTIVADGKTVVLEEGAEGITITGTTSIEGAVAKIGDVYYSTLMAAVEAATSEEIVLVANTSVSGQNALDKLTGKTLNLDGKTLTVSGNSYFEDGITTFKNGKIVVTGYATDSFFCGYTAGAVIVFDGVEISGDSYKTGCAVFNANLGKVEVKNSTVTLSGDAEGGVFYGGVVSVDNSVITATNVCRGFTNSVATIANDSEFTFDGGETGLNNSTVTIDDSTVEIKNATKRAVRLHNNTLTVTNGSTLTATGCAEDIVYYDPTSEAQVVKSDYSTIAATIPSLEKVASIGTNRYFTLADAFAAANDGDTITLLADVTVDTTIKVNANIILDLNGKTITGKDNATGSFALIEIQPGAELTVKDETGEGKITLIATNERNTSAYSSVISNQRGKLIVNGGTLEHLGGTYMAYGIDNLTNGKETYAETVINGGTIKSTYRAIRQFLNGVEAQNILTINGGTIEGVNKSVWMQDPNKNANTGSLTIGENATLKGDVYLFVTAGSTEWPVEVSIASAALKDGAKVTTGNVPAGYELAETNGTYGIMTGVAKIGNTYYATLADAIAAVGAGDVVIELIANATFDYNARDAYGTAETTSLTINGNGYTLTLNQKDSDWASIGLANTNAKLVLNDMTIEKTGYGDTSGAWNTHAIIFSCQVEMNDVTVNNSVAVQNGATLTNVKINEANGYYGLWINGNGQTVTMTGGEINATNGGRGIKIADQYIDAPASVNLTVDGTKFNTAKKAAVLVSSTAGAAITASNVDITNVAEDSTNIAWVDEDWSTDYGKVTVTGGTLSQESVENFTMIVRDEDDNIIAYYDDLGELFADYKDSNDTIYVLLVADVSTNNVVYADSDTQVDFNFTTNVEGGVTITLGYTGGWNYIPHMTIGNNVTLNVPYRMCVYGKVLDIYGTVNTGYLYNLSGSVTVMAGGVLDVTTGDKTIQVKNNGWFEVYGTAKAGTVNVWNSNTRASQVIVSGANASLTADHIHAWDGGNATKANTVTVENGAILTATNFQADRGSEVTVSDATVNATTITLGYDDNVGKLIESGNSVINGTININSTNATVKSDGGLGNNLSTTKEGYKVVYDEENGVYKIAQYAIMVTYPVGNPVYPEGKVEYYDNMIDAVPYTTNCPRLEGATITLLNDVSGAGMRFMENGMVFDLNGHTYTITAGTGSQGTNTSGFQIRPEVTTNVIIKNGTIKVAEGAPVVWMFNCYATDFIVEDVTVDCTNMAWGYGESCYVAVSRSGDGIQLKGNTKVENFDATVAGNAYSVGGTMSVEENVVVGGTIQLDAGATLVAREGLDVVAVDGYKLIYENGTYSTEKIVAKIGETAYTSFEAALEAVQDGETITILYGATGDEKSTEIEFTKDIEFTITGNAPDYALPVITFQNATVTIKDAEILIPELDARQNATINVVDSIVHDAGGNSIVKSYYNGAINISGTSVVYTMQVTTMGYITISDTAKLHATWQTNVYGNGMITVEDDAVFNTAALQLTGKDYSGRDNTDADRVGKPATIIVDGATFTVGKVYSDNGADYSYNSSYGINIGTIADKAAVLDVKNGATVNFYMANGQTANIGADGIVNVDGSTFNFACRDENGVATLANNGTIYVTGASDVAANVTGAGWIYMNGVTLGADTKLYGAKVGFINGTNAIVGSTIADGFFSVGIGQNAEADAAAAFATANGITLGDVTVNVSGNAIIGGNGETYSGWVGSAYSADKTQHKYVLNIENSLAAFGYLHISKDGELNVTGHATNKYTYDNANVDFYAGDFIINGVATFNGTDVWAKTTKISADHADAVLNIVNGTKYEMSRHNGATTGTTFVFYKAGKVNVDETSMVEIDNATALVDGAELIIAGDVVAKGTITGNGTITLTDKDATLTAIAGITVATDIADHKVVYADGAYKVVEKAYVAQIGTDGAKFESLADAIAAATAGDTIVLLADVTENVTINKNITIDGAEKNYTGTMTVNTSLTVTIQNVNFVNGCIAEAKGTHGTLTVKGCDFDGGNTVGYAITVRGADKVAIENCTAKNYTYGMLYIPSSVASVSVKDIVVENCTAAFNISYSGNGTFENVTLTKVTYGIHAQNYGARTFTIKNWTLDTCTYPVYVQQKGTATVSFAIEDALTLTTVENSQYTKFILNNENATLTAPEGSEVTPFDSANYVVKYVDGTYRVYEAVAQIGNTLYATVQDAINAAQDDDIVVLRKDIVLTWDGKLAVEDIPCLLIVKDKRITLDLNGKAITADMTGMTGTYNIGVVVAGSGDLTVDATGGGSIKASGIKAYSLFSAFDTTTKLTINGGTYELEEAMDCLIHSAGDEIVTINGGIFTLGNLGVGTNGQPWIFNANGQNIRKVIVNGGTFNADVNHQFWANEVFVPETKALKDNGDGTWTVVDAVAYVVERATSNGASDRKVGYATLAEAVASNGTPELGTKITLLADVVDVTVDINKATTIDKNGFEITNSQFVIATATATLTAPEGLNVVTNLVDYMVNYKDGTYSVALAAAKVNGVLYATLAEAITAADAMVPPATVVLTSDVQETYVVIPDGVYLDLDGKTLTASYVASFGGVIIDTKNGEGVLVVPMAHLMLRNITTHLAMYDATTGGYRFFEFALKIGVKSISDAKRQYVTRLEFTNTEAYTLLAKGSASTGVTLQFALWMKNSADDVKTHTISDATIAEYAAVATQSGKVIYVNVNGLDNSALNNDVLYTNYTVSVAGASASSVTLDYSIEVPTVTE